MERTLGVRNFMADIKVGNLLEDANGYLLWILQVDDSKKILYAQDDPIQVLYPCARVIRVFNICDDLEDEFQIREPTEPERDRFLEGNRSTLLDINKMETLPAPPQRDLLEKTAELNPISMVTSKIPSEEASCCTRGTTLKDR